MDIPPEDYIPQSPLTPEMLEEVKKRYIEVENLRDEEDNMSVHPVPSDADWLEDELKRDMWNLFPALLESAQKLHEIENGTAPKNNQGHHEPCYYCGDPCNSLAANPGLWPIYGTHPEEPGVVKWHHVSCVFSRCREYDKLSKGPYAPLPCRNHWHVGLYGTEVSEGTFETSEDAQKRCDELNVSLERVHQGEKDQLRTRIVELEKYKDRILWLSRICAGSYINYDLISYWPNDGDGWAVFNEQARDANEPLSIHRTLSAAIDEAIEVNK